MQEPRDPTEIALNFGPVDDLFNRIERGRSALPDEPRTVFAENTDQVREPLIGDAREMGRRATCIASGQLAPFEQADFFSGLFQEIGGGETGHATADHDDVAHSVMSQFGKSR